MFTVEDLNGLQNKMASCQEILNRLIRENTLLHTSGLLFVVDGNCILWRTLVGMRVLPYFSITDCFHSCRSWSSESESDEWSRRRALRTDASRSWLIITAVVILTVCLDTIHSLYSSSKAAAAKSLEHPAYSSSRFPSYNLPQLQNSKTANCKAADNKETFWLLKLNLKTSPLKVLSTCLIKGNTRFQEESFIFLFGGKQTLNTH